MTISVVVAEVEARNDAVPWYVAITLKVPAGNPEIGTLATPDAFSEADPTIVPSIRKITTPVGTPDADVTVAVNVNG